MTKCSNKNLSVKFLYFSEERIYLNPDNCDDCVLKQLEQEDLDTCGGRKVADGSAEDGTMYRYIASGEQNLLPVS